MSQQQHICIDRQYQNYKLQEWLYVALLKTSFIKISFTCHNVQIVTPRLHFIY